MMTVFDPFYKDNVDVGDVCCGKKPQKPREPKVHAVPGLLTPAPDWSGVAIVKLKIQNISLKDYKGKYLILFFYPYDFTFICPTEMIQFNDRIEEFDKLGCKIVAVSTDSQYSHLAWVITPRKQGGLGNMDIVVLSDKNHKISKMYGVLDEEEGISVKALFIIDENQLIRHIAIHEVCSSRSVDETLRILEACKFVDKYGNTCPAGPRESLPSVNADVFKA